MLAELVSFQNLLQRSRLPDQAASFSQLHTTSTWWSTNYSWAREWSRSSFVFFSLSSLVVVLWTICEFVGSLEGAHNGNIWMSLGSALVNVCLLCGIMLFLSAGASDGNNLHSGWYGPYFQKTMVRLLGGSSGGKENLNGSEHLWQGRILFLRQEMTRISNETKKDCTDILQSMESMIHQSEARIRNEVMAVEKGLNDLSNERHEKNEQLLGMMAELLETARRSGPVLNSGK